MIDRKTHPTGRIYEKPRTKDSTAGTYETPLQDPPFFVVVLVTMRAEHPPILTRSVLIQPSPRASPCTSLRQLTQPTLSQARLRSNHRPEPRLQRRRLMIETPSPDSNNTAAVGSGIGVIVYSPTPSPVCIPERLPSLMTTDCSTSEK
jgi:hypothetical protein